LSLIGRVLLRCVVSRQLYGFAREGIEAESRAAPVPNRHAFKSERGGDNFLDDLAYRGFAFLQGMFKMVVEILRQRFAF
jgi:hypothetical protein